MWLSLWGSKAPRGILRLCPTSLPRRQPASARSLGTAGPPAGPGAANTAPRSVGRFPFHLSAAALALGSLATIHPHHGGVGVGRGTGKNGEELSKPCQVVRGTPCSGHARRVRCHRRKQTRADRAGYKDEEGASLLCTGQSTAVFCSHGSICSFTSHFTSIQGCSVWLVAYRLHSLRAIPLLSLCLFLGRAWLGGGRLGSPWQYQRASASREA